MPVTEEIAIPHVILKMVEGRTEEQKWVLADALTLATASSLGCGAHLVSLAIEDVKDAEWMAEVYGLDSRGRSATIYRMLVYGPED